MSPAHPTGDLWAEAAELLGETGRSAEDARRYRDLADTVAGPCFERAIAIGSEVRGAARRGTSEPLPALITELRALTARCRSAVSEVQAGRPYQEAVLAFRSGETARAAELACVVFDRVAPHLASSTLYHPLAIGGGRSVDHFLPPPQCAERIETLKREGLAGSSTPPELGGDEAIRPVLLAEQHDEADSPIALAFNSGLLPGTLCRLEGRETVLFYAERLRTTFTVSCAGRVSDEWWKIRPDAYRSYLEELRAALTARSIAMIVEPDAGDRA